MFKYHHLHTSYSNIMLKNAMSQGPRITECKAGNIPIDIWDLSKVPPKATYINLNLLPLRFFPNVAPSYRDDKIVIYSLRKSLTFNSLAPGIFERNFNENWRYHFTRANNFCLLELIWVALGHRDELQKVEKFPIRWSLLTGFIVA